ncbi:MAG TPA: hypothetical protein VFE54_10575 [Mucilaginibacter sp.]|nr:hypothetical protein [Mucilaginibacter sp.]
MKQLILALLVFFMIVSTASAQSHQTPKQTQQTLFDSLWYVNRKLFLAGKLDSLPTLNIRLLQLAEKIKEDSTYMWAYNAIGNYFTSKANYSLALDYDFRAAQIAEEKLPGCAAVLDANLAGVYNFLENYNLALYYLRKGQRFLSVDRINGKVYVPIVFATVYSDMNKPDSALKYIQQAYQLSLGPQKPDIRVNNSMNQGMIYRNFGRIYNQLREPELVSYYYKKGIRFCDSVKLPRVLEQLLNDYSAYLVKEKKYAEAKNYGIKSFTTGRSSGYKKFTADAADQLFNLYKLQGRDDSAYYYLQAKNLYQDSILAEQKTNQLQAVIASQQLKETEQSARAARDAEERTHNIEYAAIALGIVIFIMLFLLLSRSIIVNTRTIEIVGVVGLLIVFEFINLVVHPYLAEFTHDSPVLMLLILVLIAAVIVPLHHRLEYWIKHKLVEKNKAIQLAAAKRTIEKLEGGK